MKKKSVKAISAGALILWTIAIVVIVIFITDAGLAASMVFAHAAIAGAWLGMDIGKVRSRSLALPAGQGANVKTFRYSLCAGCSMALLIFLAYFFSEEKNEISPALQVLGASAGASIAALVAALNVVKNSAMKRRLPDGKMEYSQEAGNE